MSTAQKVEPNSELHSPSSGDGTVTAFTETAFQPAVGFGLLNLLLPMTFDPANIAGRYFLARCGAQSTFEREHHWGIYFRRPLFFASFRQLPKGTVDAALPSGSLPSGAVDADTFSACQFMLPNQPFISSSWVGLDSAQGDSTDIADPGFAWLAQRTEDEPVNLLGPFGNGFTIKQDTRNLLLIARQGRVATLLPLVELMLNRGGRVTIIVQTSSLPEQEALQAFLLPLLPIAVELRLAHTHKEWREHLAETLVWADQTCAALPHSDLNGLVMLIREKRFLLQETFAQVLVDADLICGVGACLACVVPTATGGHTRACINGPVFDLTRLIR